MERGGNPGRRRKGKEGEGMPPVSRSYDRNDTKTRVIRGSTEPKPKSSGLGRPRKDASISRQRVEQEFFANAWTEPAEQYPDAPANEQDELLPQTPQTLSNNSAAGKAPLSEYEENFHPSQMGAPNSSFHGPLTSMASWNDPVIPNMTHPMYPEYTGGHVVPMSGPQHYTTTTQNLNSAGLEYSPLDPPNTSYVDTMTAGGSAGDIHSRRLEERIQRKKKIPISILAGDGSFEPVMAVIDPKSEQSLVNKSVLTFLDWHSMSVAPGVNTTFTTTHGPITAEEFTTTLLKSRRYFPNLTDRIDIYVAKEDIPHCDAIIGRPLLQKLRTEAPALSPIPQERNDAFNYNTGVYRPNIASSSASFQASSPLFDGISGNLTPSTAYSTSFTQQQFGTLPALPTDCVDETSVEYGEPPKYPAGDSRFWRGSRDRQ